MNTHRKHLIRQKTSIREALSRLDELAADSILFVVDEQDRLVGSLTDGDVRRGFLKGLSVDSMIDQVIQSNPKFIFRNRFSVEQLAEFRNKNFRIIPILDDEHRVVDIVNFRFSRSYLPLDAIVMAGGRGERLRPLTDTLPKPLLRVGDKAIIEHNIERLASFGVRTFTISVRYLGDMIKSALGDGSARNISISYVEENEPLGTIGSVSLVDKELHDYVLVTNSDILTNLDYEDFFLDFMKQEADCSIVTIPYHVDVPYAVFETSNGHIVSFKEKPTYTYHSNGGIYLFRKHCLDLIPERNFFNATDLLEELIRKGMKVISYPLRGYWLDIGRHEDFRKAQEDIQHIKF